jgi:hypothetical protein
MNFRQAISLISALALAAGLAACGGSSHTTTTPPPAISIAFTGTVPTSLPAGTTAMITATVSNDSSNGGVNWSVSCGSAGACGTFSASNTASGSAVTYTAPSAIPTGSTVTITATAKDSSSATVMATVTITAPPPISVAFSPTPPTTLLVSASTTLTAVVSNDSTNAGVTFSVTCGSALCGGFTNVTTTTATYTAPAAVPTGNTVTVTATSKTDATKSAMATITITTPPPISVVFNPVPPTALQISTSTMLTAVVSNDSANAGVTFSVTCGSALCGGFSNVTTTTATYTAPAAVPTGNTVMVIATSVTDPTKSAMATITIQTGPVITVQLGTVPASLQVGTSAPITATTNDSAGVNWSCTPLSTCGSFNPTSTLSGVATGFTAPATVPTGNNVTVTATSVTDNTKFASATILITTTNTTLSCSPQTPPCNFVFSVSGADATGFYSVAGVFTINSVGAITAGEQDFVDFETAAHDTINPGTSSVSTTADGNLQIVLDTQDTSIGVSGVETFNGTLACTCTARIIEFDSSATGTGTLDLQNSKASPTGGYAFSLNGVDTNDFALAIGGIVNVDIANGDGSAGISGNGSIFDVNDNGSGTSFQAETFAASTVSAPDSLGMVTFTLNPTDSADFPQTVLVGYIVDGSRIRLVETVDSLQGSTGGTAFGQGVNTGAFTTIAGNSYVVGLSGFDVTGAFQVAGVLSTGGSGSTGPVSGLISYNDLSTLTATPSTLSAGGTYSVDTFGRVTMTNLTDGVETFNLQVYLKGDGQALAISMDSTDVLGGMAFGQNGTFTNASFFGSYALAAGGADVTNENPLFTVGPVTADGVSAFTGFADINWLTPTADQTVTGSFAADVSGEFLTGTITGLDVTTPANVDNFTYYPIDTTRIVTIESDANQLTLGFFDLQQ